MRKPMLARSTVTRISLFVASALLLAACAGDVTAPVAPPLTPTAANRSLKEVRDGVYRFTVNPQQNAIIPLGASRLELPAHSICKIGSTKYGPQYWNAPCDDEKRPVEITAIVKHANSNKPSIEFYPAMRFDPDENVTLTIAVTDAETLSYMTVMKYCPDNSSKCLDESLTDASLKTTVDKARGLVSRRIKHFSGYVVAENTDLPPILP